MDYFSPDFSFNYPIYETLSGILPSNVAGIEYNMHSPDHAISSDPFSLNSAPNVSYALSLEYSAMRSHRNGIDYLPIVPSSLEIHLNQVGGGSTFTHIFPFDNSNNIFANGFETECIENIILGNGNYELIIYGAITVYCKSLFKYA